MNRLCPLLILFSLTWAGCAGSAESEEPEHGRPPHWPATFAVLVEDLETRTEQPPAAGSTEASELDDLFAWLPEIAADTSLLEADWKAAVAAGERLKANEDRSAALDELRKLADKTRGDPPPFQPRGHDHHDHDGEDDESVDGDAS